MRVPDDRIDEFITLWERAFGERIKRDQARTKARQLLELYRAMAEDLTRQDPKVAPPPRDAEPPPSNPPGGGA